jgi:PIN domain nuclease of toxin-antitoxin system
VSILIDTQVFVWLIEKDRRLGPNALQILSDTSNGVSISYFSFFEMTIKASVGKLTYDVSVIEDLPKMGIELVAADIGALKNYSILNPSNKDPFDNIIMSVARSEKLTLMTSDPKILAVNTSRLRLLDATV